MINCFIDVKELLYICNLTSLFCKYVFYLKNNTTNYINLLQKINITLVKQTVIRYIYQELIQTIIRVTLIKKKPTNTNYV